MKKIEKEMFWTKLEPEAEKKGLKVHRGLGERLPPHHQLQAPDQHAGRPAGHQAARARGQVAREDVPGLRRQPFADEVLGGIHRAADRRDGRPGEPVHADRQRQVPGGAEVPVAHRATSTRRPTSTVGAKKWATLPADVRKLARGHRPRRRRRSSTKRRRRTTSELLGKMKAAGMQVNNANKDAFIAASQAGVRGVRQGSAGREGDHRPRHRARQVSAGDAGRAAPALRAPAGVDRHRPDGGPGRRGDGRRGVPHLRRIARLVRRGRLDPARVAHVLRLGARRRPSARTSAARRSIAHAAARRRASRHACWPRSC